MNNKRLTPRTEEVELVDPETGELYRVGFGTYPAETHTVVRKGGRPKQKVTLPFIRLFDTIQTERAKGNISFDECSVLYACVELTSWEDNYVRDPDTGRMLSIISLAKYLSKDRIWLRDILTSLHNKGLIVFKNSRGRNGSNILVSPKVSWCGGVSDKSKSNKSFSVPISERNNTKDKIGAVTPEPQIASKLLPPATINVAHSYNLEKVTFDENEIDAHSTNLAKSLDEEGNISSSSWELETNELGLVIVEYSDTGAVLQEITDHEDINQRWDFSNWCLKSKSNAIVDEVKP